LGKAYTYLKCLLATNWVVSTCVGTAEGLSPETTGPPIGAGRAPLLRIWHLQLRCKFSGTAIRGSSHAGRLRCLRMTPRNPRNQRNPRVMAKSCSWGFRYRFPTQKRCFSTPPFNSFFKTYELFSTA
jgi:hypothetical protein